MNQPPPPRPPSELSPARARPAPDHPLQTHHGPATGEGDRRRHRDGAPPVTRRAHLLQAGAILVLSPVAGIAAALSFQSLHEAAAPIFGPLALGFPLLVDMLILGSTLAFLAGASAGRALPGWRWTAHGGVSGTLALNALAASGPATIAWHITPALVWSVLVEMSARQVTGRPSSTAAAEPIPVRIWLSSPLDAFRTWLQMARSGQPCHRQARADLAVHAAARQALRTAMPQRRQRGARRLISRQLRFGALDPSVLLEHLRGPLHRTVAQHHTAVVIQTLLDVSPTDRIGADRPDPPEGRPRHPPEPGAADSRSPARAAPTRPPAEPHPTGHDAAPHRALSAERRQRRQQTAMDILRTQPGIGATHLARELTERGWPVSRRTAQRVLTDASYHLSAQTTDLAAAAAGDPAAPNRRS
jgi:hypothetical protein